VSRSACDPCFASPRDKPSPSEATLQRLHAAKRTLEALGLLRRELRAPKQGEDLVRELRLPRRERGTSRKPVQARFHVRLDHRGGQTEFSDALPESSSTGEHRLELIVGNRHSRERTSVGERELQSPPRPFFRAGVFREIWSTLEVGYAKTGLARDARPNAPTDVCAERASLFRGTPGRGYAACSPTEVWA
jgi:hypothetical protein